MIEILTGERGFRVIRRDGRLLASRFDPLQEAAAWIERRTPFLNKVKSIFVLGLGSGYHIQALLERTEARIIVIEPDARLIAAVGEIGIGVHRRVHVECVQSARELRSAPSVREAVVGSFIVLVHAPSKAGRQQLFNDCAAQLRGREWGALTWQWQVKNAPALDSTPRVHAQGDPLTIYDLEQTELVQDSEVRERMLLKALRELVK